MSWLETAAIVGDVVGADALGAGASALGAGALSDAILPSALDSLGSEFGTTEAFNAAGFGPNSAMAANTTSGGIGAGAGAEGYAADAAGTATRSLSPSVDPTVGGVGAANGSNAAANAGYSTPMTNYAISPAANGITASGAGAANGLSIAPSAASVGANGAASYGLNAASATSGGVMDYFNSALDWMNGHKTATAVGAGILGSKLGLFNGKSNPGVDTTYRGILNDYKFNPNTFKPGGNANSTAITPNAYPNYRAHPYASGGIAMAMGGEPGQMYPQSQQDRTTFTPAPTMPNSMNNMMAGYDTPTDPMTGDISQRLASGGVARYASGDLTNTNDFLNMAGTGSTASLGNSKGHHTDSLMQELNQYATLGTNPDPFNTGYGAVGSTQGIMGQGVVGNDDPDLRGKNPYQRAQIMNAKLAAVANMQGQMTATPNTPTLGGLNMAPPQQTQTAANGGIMRYASGGAPDNASDMAINQMFGLNSNAVDPKTGILYSQEQQSNPGSGVLGDAVHGIGQDITNIGQGISNGVSSIGKSLGFAHGGISGGFNLGGYSDGGRLLKGPGDGMSDNIPATIAHKQPARLADGEFVVPADVVSHLGNGSTDAGAKRLYAMMDKVRHARTGSKKQGKEINAEKFLPT